MNIGGQAAKGTKLPTHHDPIRQGTFRQIMGALDARLVNATNVTGDVSREIKELFKKTLKLQSTPQGKSTDRALQAMSQRVMAHMMANPASQETLATMLRKLNADTQNHAVRSQNFKLTFENRILTAAQLDELNRIAHPEGGGGAAAAAETAPPSPPVSVPTIVTVHPNGGGAAAETPPPFPKSIPRTQGAAHHKAGGGAKAIPRRATDPFKFNALLFGDSWIREAGGQTTANIADLRTMLRTETALLETYPDFKAFVTCDIADFDLLENPERLVKKVRTLQVGSSIALSGGWCGDLEHKSGHAIIYKIRRDAQASFSFTILNTGMGIQNHAAKSDAVHPQVKDFRDDAFQKTKYYPEKAFYHISENDICDPNFYATLLSLKKGRKQDDGTFERHGLILSGNEAYDIAEHFLADRGDAAEPPREADKWISPQKEGTCSMKCTLALIRTYMTKEEYKGLLFRLKEHSLRDLFAHVQTLEHMDKDQLYILEESTKSFGKTCLKARKDTLITQEKLEKIMTLSEEIRNFIGIRHKELNKTLDTCDATATVVQLPAISNFSVGHEIASTAAKAYPAFNTFPTVFTSLQNLNTIFQRPVLIIIRDYACADHTQMMVSFMRQVVSQHPLRESLNEIKGRSKEDCSTLMDSCLGIAACLNKALLSSPSNRPNETRSYLSYLSCLVQFAASTIAKLPYPLLLPVNFEKDQYNPVCYLDQEIAQFQSDFNTLFYEQGNPQAPPISIVEKSRIVISLEVLEYQFEIKPNALKEGLSSEPKLNSPMDLFKKILQSQVAVAGISIDAKDIDYNKFKIGDTDIVIPFNKTASMFLFQIGSTDSIIPVFLNIHPQLNPLEKPELVTDEQRLANDKYARSAQQQRSHLSEDQFMNLQSIQQETSMGIRRNLLLSFFSDISNVEILQNLDMQCLVLHSLFMNPSHLKVMDASSGLSKQLETFIGIVIDHAKQSQNDSMMGFAMICLRHYNAICDKDLMRDALPEHLAYMQGRGITNNPEKLDSYMALGGLICLSVAILETPAEVEGQREAASQLLKALQQKPYPIFNEDQTFNLTHFCLFAIGKNIKYDVIKLINTRDINPLLTPAEEAASLPHGHLYLEAGHSYDVFTGHIYRDGIEQTRLHDTIVQTTPVLSKLFQTLPNSTFIPGICVYRFASESHGYQYDAINSVLRITVDETQFEHIVALTESHIPASMQDKYAFWLNVDGSGGYVSSLTDHDTPLFHIKKQEAGFIITNLAGEELVSVNKIEDDASNTTPTLLKKVKNFGTPALSHLWVNSESKAIASIEFTNLALQFTRDTDGRLYSNRHKGYFIAENQQLAAIPVASDVLVLENAAGHLVCIHTSLTTPVSLSTFRVSPDRALLVSTAKTLTKKIQENLELASLYLKSDRFTQALDLVNACKKDSPYTPNELQSIQHFLKQISELTNVHEVALYLRTVSLVAESTFLSPDRDKVRNAAIVEMCKTDIGKKIDIYVKKYTKLDTAFVLTPQEWQLINHLFPAQNLDLLIRLQNHRPPAAIILSMSESAPLSFVFKPYQKQLRGFNHEFNDCWDSLANYSQYNSKRALATFDQPTHFTDVLKVMSHVLSDDVRLQRAAQVQLYTLFRFITEHARHFDMSSALILSTIAILNHKDKIAQPVRKTLSNQIQALATTFRDTVTPAFLDARRYGRTPATPDTPLRDQTKALLDALYETTKNINPRDGLLMLSLMRKADMREASAHDEDVEQKTADPDDHRTAAMPGPVDIDPASQLPPVPQDSASRIERLKAKTRRTSDETLRAKIDLSGAAQALAAANPSFNKALGDFAATPSLSGPSQLTDHDKSTIKQSIGDIQKIISKPGQTLRYKQEIIKIKKDLLTTCNRKDLSVASQMQHSGQKAFIRLPDLIQFFLQGDNAILTDKNPTLDDTAIASIRETLRTLLLKQKALKQHHHIQNKLERLATIDEDSDDYFAEAQEILSIAGQHETLSYADTEHPMNLVFESLTGFSIRADQQEMVQDLMTRSMTQPTVVQMIMGGGKTAVVLPLLALSVADGKHLATINVPESLFNPNKQELSNIFGPKLANKIHYLDYFREKEYGLEALEFIHRKLVSIIQNRDCLMIKPQNLQKLYLYYQDILLTQDASEANLAKLKVLKDILLIFKERGFAILDEADTVLNCRLVQNFTSGKKGPISDQRFEIASKIYQVFRNLVPASLTRFDGYLPEELPAVLETVLNAYFETQLLEDHHDIDDALKKQISDCVLNPEASVSKFKSLKDENPKLYADILSLKQWFSSILPYTLVQRCSVKYGEKQTRCQQVSEHLAIPYVSSNAPSEKSEFGSIECQLAFTWQLLLIEGFSEDRSHTFLKFCLIHKDIPALKDKFERYSKHALLRQFSDYSKSQLRDIRENLNQNPDAIRLYFDEIIKPSISEYPQLLSSHHLDLVSLYKRMAMFTGTTHTQDTWDNIIDCVEHQEIKQQLKTLFLSEKNNKVAVIDNTKPHGPATLEALVSDIIKSGEGEGVAYHAFIDAGAIFKGYRNEAVARTFNKTLPDTFKGVIYIDSESNQKYIVLRPNSEKILFDDMSIDPKDFFTVYDQFHTTGTDIKQHPTAKAWMSIGPDTTDRDLQQGALRMRGLAKGQSFSMILPESLKSSVETFIDKEAGKLKTQDLLMYAMKTQAIQLQKDILSAAKSKLYQVARDRILNAELHNNPEQGTPEREERLKALKSLFLLEQCTDLEFLAKENTPQNAKKYLQKMAADIQRQYNPFLTDADNEELAFITESESAKLTEEIVAKAATLEVEVEKEQEQEEEQELEQENLVMSERAGLKPYSFLANPLINILSKLKPTDPLEVGGGGAGKPTIDIDPSGFLTLDSTELLAELKKHFVPCRDMLSDALDKRLYRSIYSLREQSDKASDLPLLKLQDFLIDQSLRRVECYLVGNNDTVIALSRQEASVMREIVCRIKDASTSLCIVDRFGHMLYTNDDSIVLSEDVENLLVQAHFMECPVRVAPADLEKLGTWFDTLTPKQLGELRHFYTQSIQYRNKSAKCPKTEVLELLDSRLKSASDVTAASPTLGFNNIHDLVERFFLVTQPKALTPEWLPQIQALRLEIKAFEQTASDFVKAIFFDKTMKMISTDMHAGIQEATTEFSRIDGWLESIENQETLRLKEPEINDLVELYNKLTLRAGYSGLSQPSFVSSGFLNRIKDLPDTIQNLYAKIEKFESKESEYIKNVFACRIMNDYSDRSSIFTKDTFSQIYASLKKVQEAAQARNGGGGAARDAV